MKTVQPIRDKKKVKAMKGLRISDILNLKVEDVLNQNHVTITEKKREGKTISAE